MIFCPCGEASDPAHPPGVCYLAANVACNFYRIGKGPREIERGPAESDWEWTLRVATFLGEYRTDPPLQRLLDRVTLR